MPASRLGVAAILTLFLAAASRAPAQEALVYQVLVNAEDQYAVWLAGEDAPKGWASIGEKGPLSDATKYIEEVWTDMRPLTLRERMAERGVERDEIKYQVVVREEERDEAGEGGIPGGYYGYMLWPAGEPAPAGMAATGYAGTFDEASEYIEEVWTDMRPLSLRMRFKETRPE